MGDDGLLDEIDEDESSEDESEYQELSAQLEARCKQADLECERLIDPEGGSYVRVHMRAGRSTRPIALFGTDRLKRFLALPFERFSLVGDYAAICSYSDSFIEAAVDSLVPRGLNQLYRDLFGISSRDVDAETVSIEVTDPTGSAVTVRLGPASEELDVLGGLPSFRNRRLSIRIEEISVSRHDDALRILERLASSIFFQLDITRDVPLTISSRRRVPRRFARRRLRKDLPELEFPRAEFDQQPLSLYWYARSAAGMPLLQFLAYYQTIEFYFPTYSQAEARRKIRNVLKSPAFRADRDTDVGRLLLAAKSAGSGFGDERSQLRATIQECLESGALREFISETEEKIEHFSSKTEGLTDHKIPVRNQDADLRNDVADRIYEIRCKIVHTKSGSREGEVELLLPFSHEAELLYPDIELIQYVAREVLISASSPLQV